MEIAEHGEVLVQSNCSLLSSNTSSVYIFIDLCFDVCFGDTMATI